MQALFDAERRKQRILIDLDQTTLIMERNAHTLMQRGHMLDDNEREAQELVDSSRKLYWRSLPWWKRWLLCCYS